LVDPQRQDRRTKDGAAAVPDRFDRCATTQSGIFEAEDMRRDRKACVEAKQVAVAWHPSDGESLKTSKTSLEGLVSLVIKKGYFRLLVASI
jgi:D-hexose-6-phosphate mutarotase